MTTRGKAFFEPDYTVIPGKTLEETLEKSGMQQTELADRSGLSRKTINGIIKGSEPITPNTAIQLEKVFRVPARFWLGLQKEYEEAAARLKERERLVRYSAWIRSENIPVKELTKRGAIRETPDKISLLTEVLRFFGVASPEEYETIWQSARVVCNFRQSSMRKVSFGVVSAWLRLGEFAAAEVLCKSFDSRKFKRVLPALRSQACDSIPEIQEYMAGLLADSGVALVFIPGITGAPIYGATRWLTPDKAIVQMSLRGKDDGNFWFTLFHELGHIALHGKRDVFLEMNDGETCDKERAADRFAQEYLIPKEAYAEFIRQRRALSFSKADIRAFAGKIRVAPGVVVGRLQRDRYLPYSHCNDLKVRLGFVE